MPHLGDSTLKASGKQNSLFPLRPVIKCLLPSLKALYCIRVHRTVLTFTSEVATPFVS